jgi:hypothetical protein
MAGHANAQDCANPISTRPECAIQQDVLEQAAERACRAQLDTGVSDLAIQQCIDDVLTEGDEP